MPEIPYGTYAFLTAAVPLAFKSLYSTYVLSTAAVPLAFPA